MFSKDSVFRREPNDGNLRQPRTPTRVSTVVLHRPNPVAREMPSFTGFFARRGQLAEREGFASPLAFAHALYGKAVCHPTVIRSPPTVVTGLWRTNAICMRDRTSRRDTNWTLVEFMALPRGIEPCFSLERAAYRSSRPVPTSPPCTRRDRCSH